MNIESMLVVTAERNGKMRFGGFLALTAAVMLWLAPAMSVAAGSGDSGSGGKSDAVRFESIPGSTIKRVILAEKAAERLGIETGEVREQPIIRTQMVGGRVTLPAKDQPQSTVNNAGFAGARLLTATAAKQPMDISGKTLASDDGWVLVTLSKGEWDKLVKDHPARVLPLATRDSFATELYLEPSGIPPREDLKRSMLSVYYVAPGKDHGLTLNQRVRVELRIAGSDEKLKVVPYSAVYYGADGSAWVYVNPQPLVFERQSIGVERVVGDLAVLSEGPPIGTKVVTVGVALLYGAEVVFGK